MIGELRPKPLIIYQSETGAQPFLEWLNGLGDQKGRIQITARLRRLRQGSWGDCKSIGDGLIELRIFVGPGYRVYCGEDEGNIVVILCGGDKSGQKRDIKRAKDYWKDYLQHDKS